MRVLCIGEIVGKAGIFCVKHLLPALKQEKNIDFVIAGGDGATGGYGLGRNHSVYLKKLGIDVITGGECIYYKKDMVQFIGQAPFILRPANYPHGNPGRGWRIYECAGEKIAVIVLLGQAGFNRVHLGNPYLILPEIVNRIKAETATIFLDFHACTTAEKYGMFHHAQGMVSAVVGTHTKALSADATVLPLGTAVVCDTGRTGSLLSVGGLEARVEIDKFLTQIPERSQETWDSLELQGVIIETAADGRAVAIETLRVPCTEKPHDRDRNGPED